MAAKAGRASAVVDVFISYAREDRDRAIGLVDALEHAGRSVWWEGDLNLSKARSMGINA